MKIRKRLSDDRGTSMVEFAILMPVFVFMLIGVIEVSRYMYISILASHAARAGVQYAAQSTMSAADANSNGAGTRNATLADAQNLSGFTESSTVVCTLNGQTSTCPQNTANVSVPSTLVYYVQVQVSGTFHSLVNYPGIPNSFPITATAIMPVGSQ